MSPQAAAADEPLTPIGRIYLQKKINQIVIGLVGLCHSIDVDRLKATLPYSLMVNHPLFSSLVVCGERGVDRWTRAPVINLDRHLIILENPFATVHDNEAAINQYLAELSDCFDWPGLDKPLWEIHVLVAHRCLVFRIHHSLGDATSFIALLLASCTPKASCPRELLELRVAERRDRGSNMRKAGAAPGVWILWRRAAYVAELLLRTTFWKDPRTIISGGDGVEMWPRKVATAKFSLEDMGIAKSAVANATINDVLCAIISIGLFRYMKHRSPDDLEEGTKITGIVVANTREKRGLLELSEMMSGHPGTRWGNKIGYIILPLEYHTGDSGKPLDCLRRIKGTLDQKKAWSEASFCYNLVKTSVSYVGPKVASILKHRICCNTTFVVSNIFGPQEEIAVMDNPITYIRTTSTGLPHALLIHMVSYAGRADMQVSVAKDIIPDPDFLADCFNEALIGLKSAAENVATALS